MQPKGVNFLRIYANNLSQEARTLFKHQAKDQVIRANDSMIQASERINPQIINLLTKQGVQDRLSDGMGGNILEQPTENIHLMLRRNNWLSRCMIIFNSVAVYEQIESIVVELNKYDKYLACDIMLSVLPRALEHDMEATS